MLEELFPQVQRVSYEMAPLFQVTCQVRFPPILRIENSPIEFQERIRGAFPLLEGLPKFPMMQLPVQVREAMASQIGTNGGWKFVTEDHTSSLALSSELLVLNSSKYTRWEHFLDQWRPAFDALLEIYKPSYLVSVSLRYQDFIDRVKIGAEGCSWSKLIRKELLAEAADSNFEKYMDGAHRVLRLKKDEDVVILQHGLANQANNSDVGYIIDLDFGSVGKTEVQNAENILARLHSNVGNAFRWCISDKLHELLKPTAIDNNGGG